MQTPCNCAVALCAFTSFACVWWSEHRRLYPNNIPTTWAALKTDMRTRWVPPYYRHELIQKLQRLRQEKNSVEEYYQELQTAMIRCNIVDASLAPATAAAEEDDDYAGGYEDEGDQNQNYVQPPAPPPAGRPQVYNCNGRAAPPPQVREPDHLPKLKLNIPPFEGRYVPDIYLTWELETEQRFTCS